MSVCEESTDSYRSGTGEATGMVARVGVKVALFMLEACDGVSDDSSIWLKAS